MKKIKNYILGWAVRQANYYVRQATAINKENSGNLAMFGIQYKKSLEYDRLELAENWEMLKCSLIKAMFRL